MSRASAAAGASGAAAPGAPVLGISAAALHRGGRELWAGLDLEVQPGEFIAVLGPSGSGKTTLLRSILGLQSLSAGSIRVGGTPVRRGDSRIGYVPQQRPLPPDTSMRARDLIASGAARRKLDQIIQAQGPSPISSTVGGLIHEVTAPRPGRVASIDCLRIATVARLAGAPTDPGAGLLLLKDVGDDVRAGDPLYRIHGEEPSEFGFAVEAALESSGFVLAAS